MHINLPSGSVTGQPEDAEPVRYGNAEVSYLPGSEQVTLVFGRHAVRTDAQSARDLFYCLDEIFGPYAPADCRVSA